MMSTVVLETCRGI